ncbi:MAG: hypothetical protein NC548_26025 [Lachnospiraceae bacterium]|nr:hypothetical protein [Lachnospiraceae bacterium]
MEVKKIGVFLARLQPIHNGHLALIKKMVSENDECLILIGSSDKINGRNPIPGTYRKELLISALMEDDTLGEFYKNGHVKITLLPDLTSEDDDSHEWGFYLYSNIVKEIGQHCFTMYYSDGWEIITKWFPGFILQNNVDLRLIARNNCEEGVSATEVRYYIKNEKIDLLVNYVPKCVVDNIKIIKSFIEVWKQ